jgi:pimeloyl-ACP methyl ester carboxylesterase
MPDFQTRDGTRLFYKDWGSGQPVVLVHTYVLNSDAWDYQMAFLARHGLRCVAYDRRGHGRSDRPGSGYDFDTLADDLAALLDHLGLAEITLVGHSMGAGEVARYLSRHGSARVARVLLVAPITPFMLRTAANPDGMDPAIRDLFAAAIEADYPRALRQFAPGFWGDGEEVSSEMKDWGHGLALQASLIAAETLLQANWATDFRSDLTAIDKPVLVIQGEHDQSTPLDKCGRPTAAAIPGARLIVYEGGGHALPLIARERFNRDLLDFATGVRAASADREESSAA